MVMVMVMTPVHMAHVDDTLQVIGLVISLNVAGMYAFSPIVGWAVDRLGRLAVAWVGVGILVVAFQSELYRLPLILTPENYAMGASVVIVSALLSGLLLWRRLGRLDLVAVLKTRE